jgi:(p)ppGpp synthase/HD superfamily hydrolase
MILKAIEFSTAKHQGQVRKGSGKPYVIHPISVSYLLAQFKKSKHFDELIVACLLHDTLEDTETNFVEIASEFTPLVASIVLELTSDENQIKLVGKNEYLKKKMLGISSYALYIKLIDRLHNISDQPKPQYVIDTIELIEFVKKHRKLTKGQLEICKAILKACEN